MKGFLLFGVLLLGTFLRLALSTTGHNFDMDCWQEVVDAMTAGQGVYETGLIHYGAVWHPILALLEQFRQVLGFSGPEALHGVIAAFLTGVDVGIAMLLLDMAGTAAAVWFFLCPVSIILTGYHSQMDNLAIFFALYSWSIVRDDEQRGRPVRLAVSAAAMGLSLATKHFLVLLPIWILFSPRFGTFRTRLAWTGSAFAIFGASLLPYTLEAPSRDAIVTHVLGYSSYFKVTLFWLPLAAFRCFTPTVYWLQGHGLTFLPTALFALAVLLTGLTVRRVHLRHRLHVHLLTLVVLTPSMGNQYLAWPLVACALFWRTIWSNLYVISGTFLLLLHPAGFGGHWASRFARGWLPFTIVYPDVQVWLLGLLAPIWLAWLVKRGHFTGGRRWLKGPFFDEEPATPQEEPPPASLGRHEPPGANGARSAIVLTMLLPAGLLAGPGSVQSEHAASRSHARLATARVPFLLCAKPEDESEYDDALWGNELGTATSEGSRKTAAVSVVPRHELIPDLPGASATPLATAVSLPFTKVLSGPVTDYALLTASGDVEAEYILETQRLPATGFRFVQKDGKSGSGLKPWLAVWDIKTGKGVMVLLAWAGNWMLEVAPASGKTVLRADTSPSGLERFGGTGDLPFPGALVSEFTGHWDYGAQPIARFIRAKLQRKLGLDWPPVQYNTWYASEDRLTEKQLLDSARIAADLGCELFTVDAGWYGRGPGRAWSQRLGDWEVDRERLPRGLGAIAAEVRRLGMKFGLWVEIECAAPLSPVARAHPDWFLSEGRHRLSERAVLDFGNPAALAWATKSLHSLVASLQLDYLKMDFNATMSLDGERLAPAADPLYGHYRQLAGLWQGLRAAFPALIVENCASGSQRQDAMTAALTDTHWISDNVDNLSSLAIVYGATALFPPESCSHWTCYPTPGLNEYPGPGGPLALESQFTVNMMGHFGLSGRIWDWDARTRRIATERIILYKRLRSVLREADVFHLTPQANLKAPASVQASLYLQAKSGRALLFAFQGGDPSNEARIRLRGLEANRTYFISWPEEFGPSQTIRGKELLEQGLVVSFPYRGSSAIATIEPED